MPLLHARFMEPEALRAHLREAKDEPALARTADTGTLDDAAATALTDCIQKSGEHGGSLDLDGADEWETRFLLISSLALADDALASQLLEGGWLDRRAVGAHAFGSLPLRIVRRQVSRESARAAREAVQFGWESELVNLLESAAIRAERAEEEHVILVRDRVGASPSRVEHDAPSDDEHTRLSALLAQLRELDGTDLTLTVGLPPTAHGAFGSKPLDDDALTPDDLGELLSAAVPPEALEVRGPTVHSIASPDVGRFRVTLTTERGFRAATFRALPRVAPTLDALGVSPLVKAPLFRIDRGLVLLAGEPGSGRTTFLSALLQQYIANGKRVRAESAAPRLHPQSRRRG